AIVCCIPGGELVLDGRRRDQRLLRHQQVERQRRERAGRYEQKMLLVPDQHFHWLDQRRIELVCGAEIEQLALFVELVELVPVFGHVDIEAAAEGGDFSRQLLAPDRNDLPIEGIARGAEDMTLLLSCQKE